MSVGTAIAVFRPSLRTDVLQAASADFTSLPAASQAGIVQMGPIHVVKVPWSGLRQGNHEKREKK